MEDHSRTIVHIDIDCFYAQVEIIKQPHLKDRPLGIQQKNIVVTSNYIARQYGIKKCMSILEAKRLCPQLILVNGEDLYDYRQVSHKVSEILREFSEFVEKLGLDENFVDITSLVKEQLSCVNGDITLVGCIFGDQNSILCDCGCVNRIKIGSQIAQSMRQKIYEKLQLTTCAGISHNKLLAKIICSKNKPNLQTSIFPDNAFELMHSLGNIENIPWIGNVSTERLNKNHIYKVEDLQNCDINQLEQIFDKEKAKYFFNLSNGIDITPVKISGKPQSIGLEDACKPLSTENEVEQKIRELVNRLLILAHEDGRIPKVLKISIRRFDPSHPHGGSRETKQSIIDFSLNNEEMISASMRLFRKLVVKYKLFKITLVEVSLSKFVVKPNLRNTLSSFLTKPSGEKMKDNSNVNYEQNPKCLKLSDNAESSSYTHGKHRETVGTILPEQCNISDSVGLVKCPPGINKDVFKELPLDVQTELWNDYQSKIDSKKKSIQKLHSKNKCNTLFNYVVRLPKE